MIQTPFYDPNKSYEQNFNEGPFGAFSHPEVLKDKNEPKYDFLGQKVNLPFGIPAGPLINGRFARAALDKGYDICTYKTIRTGEYPCHPWPNVLSVDVKGDLTPELAARGLTANTEYIEPLSITNSFGVPSKDPDFWQKDLADAVSYAKAGQVVVGSFQGTARGDASAYVKDFVLAARLVKETGVKILEVNLSCPNEGTSHLLCFDIERSRQVVEAIKSEIGDTLLIGKIAYFVDEKKLMALISGVGPVLDGISAINTIAAEIRDKNGGQALPGEGRLKSGVCGAAIKWAGLDMVKRLKRLRSELNLKYTVIGVGGVMEPSDYFEYKTAGADAVMSATGAMWNPYLAKEIKDNN